MAFNDRDHRFCAVLVCVLAVGHLVPVTVAAASRHHSYFEYGHSLLHAPHDRNRSTCPRDESRWAAEVLQEYVFSHLGRNAPQQLPPSCPLRPDLNMFSVEEAHRQHKRHGLWVCGFCKKKFRTDKYLEKHFERKHANMTPATATVCLADFCDALHCPWFHARRFSIGPKKKGGNTAALSANCLPASAARAAAECEALADECFAPSKGRAWASMNRFFHTHFCGALTCDHTASERLLTAAHKATHRRGSLLVVVIVLLLLMILFYTGLLFYWTETRKRQGGGRGAVGIGGRPGYGGTGLRALGRGPPAAAAAAAGAGAAGGPPSWLPPPPSWFKAKNY